MAVTTLVLSVRSSVFFFRRFYQKACGDYATHWRFLASLMHSVLATSNEALAIATLKKNIFYSITHFLSLSPRFSLLPSSSLSDSLSLSLHLTLLSFLVRLPLFSVFFKEILVVESLIWWWCGCVLGRHGKGLRVVQAGMVEAWSSISLFSSLS